MYDNNGNIFYEHIGLLRQKRANSELDDKKVLDFTKRTIKTTILLVM